MRRYSSSVFPAASRLPADHPEAEAVYLMGWVGFLAVVPWIQALGWAFRPTTVIDVRYLPAEEKHETEEMIARMTGPTPLLPAAAAEPSDKSAPA